MGWNRIPGTRIIISKNVCLSVRPFIGSASGHDRDLRSVLLEPEWPQVELLKKKIPENWPVAKLPNKMLSH
jgi:hypothetical protein